VHSNESKTAGLTGVNKNARLGGISVSFFRIPSPTSGGAARAKKGRTIIFMIFDGISNDIQIT
jgi:hypothetical protein